MNCDECGQPTGGDHVEIGGQVLCGWCLDETSPLGWFGNGEGSLR